MGEFAVTANAGDVLTTIGLGSCVGIALLDPKRRVAGLAHVMFPFAPDGDVALPGKYADTAVGALIAALCELGARAGALAAVLTGGARMFTFDRAAGGDIGARNVAAAEHALAGAGIPIRASATGGITGRSIRVRAGDGVVRVREAGTEAELYRPPGAPDQAGDGR